MNHLRPQLRGLIFKLAVFYIGLSLPTLILVESAILIFEFQRFMADIDRGSLERASEQAATQLARRWPPDPRVARAELATWLEAWILRLTRPREDLLPEESYVLLELSSNPVAGALLAPDGSVLATARNFNRKLELPRYGQATFTRAMSSPGAVRLPGTDSPLKIRRLLVPVRAEDGRLLGLLFVELRLPLPWRKVMFDISFEWQIILAYLVVFGLASSFFLAAWVTRRLNRVASAAEAWSRGDFTNLIGDHSRDELGRLSERLDHMAGELKGLMHSRAQLATLEERQRLARDLHDTIKQKAFALNLQLATARRLLGGAGDVAHLGEAQRLCREIQQELAQILDELRVPDTDLPFAERLRARAENWAHSSGMALSFTAQPLPTLPVTLEESLLRIADEALANTLRHSGASRIGIELGRDADRLTLAISDDGRGAPGDAREGMGLRNMRERAEALPDGRFALDSLPGRGTCIRIDCRIPGPA